MMDLETLRAAWAADWSAMKAGTYVPPLPPVDKIAKPTRHTNGRPPARIPTKEENERKASICSEYIAGDKMELIACRHGVTRMYVNNVVRKAGLPYRKTRK